MRSRWVIIVMVGKLAKYLVPVRPRLADVTDEDAIRADLELNLAFDTALFKQNLGNSEALRISDLDDLSFHNYIVITMWFLVNRF